MDLLGYIMQFHLLMFLYLHYGTDVACRQYSGTVCTKFLDRVSVFVNLTVPDVFGAGDRLVQHVVEDMAATSHFCHDPIHSVMCRHTFPDCRGSSMQPKPRLLCRYAIFQHLLLYTMFTCLKHIDGKYL